MSGRERRVLIVGGGIGGMAAAIALRRKGIAVALIDIDPDWKVYGAGITITAPTLRAFRDLGLLDQIATEGFLSKGQRLFLFDGTLLAEQDPPPIEPGLPASGGIMRPKLHRIMSDAVRQGGTSVRLGLTVDALHNHSDGVDVTFSDGSSGRYDVVVGADGIYSRIRGLLFPSPAQPVYTGQMSWRVVTPRPSDMERAEFYFGHAHIGGIVPCSQAEAYAFILHADPDSRKIAGDDQPEYLRQLMASFGGNMGNVRDGIGEHSSIVARPFEYAFQQKPWHVGRTVLIGDAAHATTPHLASGAGIAVEDGLVLADELDNAGDVIEGLAAFVERRFERCRFVVETSAEIGRRELAGAPPQEIGMLMGRAMAYLGGRI